MVRLGTESGVRTTALLTAMDVPLGRAVGNAVEVAESVRVLRGEGPDDLVTVTLALAREMLALAGIDADPAEALADGRALAKYREMIAGQGGDPDADLPVAAHVQVVPAGGTGWQTGGLAGNIVETADFSCRSGSSATRMQSTWTCSRRPAD